MSSAADNTDTNVSRIKKLEESVINRIAAGEVVQRPANGLKELIENSIDAKSTNIQIIVNAGGLKLLQIQDNGHGINRDDLAIVCERFTTSKLATFEDLSKISTYGFRGEALSSLSHVSYITITTRTMDTQCAYRAKYRDGKLAGDNPSPKPCAGNIGTIISVEDLFYNMPLRRKALTNPTEEFHRISDVVTKYSIHNDSLAFSLKKSGSTTLEVNSPSSATQRDRIRSFYGAAIERELLDVEDSCSDLEIKFNGVITNPNFSGKKLTFILFINNRLVDCNTLKHAIENLYAQYIPKHTHPFIYLSLSLLPQNVDVNIHPTKHEVRFLHEEAIVSYIERAVDKVLLTANTSRSFSIQKSITTSHVNASEILKTKTQDNSIEKNYDYNLVRTDPKIQKLDLFFPAQSTQIDTQTKSKICENPDVSMIPVNNDPLSTITTEIIENIHLDGMETDNNFNSTKTPKFETINPSVCLISSQESDLEIVSESKRAKLDPTLSLLPTPLVNNRRNHIRKVELTSVLTLKQDIIKKNYLTLHQLFQNHTYIGCVDQTQVLVQYDTGLYLLNLTHVTEELFYQLYVLDFANFACLRFSTPLSLYELAIIGLESPNSGWKEGDGDKESLANFMVTSLQSKCKMLSDYFSLEIDSNGNICTIPMLLDGYVPNMNQLPFFIMRLVTEVDWEVEMDCFQMIGREISRFYAIRESVEAVGGIEEGERSPWKRVIEHTVMPSLRKEMMPPESLLKEGAILQLADLHELYKVFERC
ncbi:DNA mismatch repair protein Mlh1 isoform X1 [Oopsacas minuta]|uniref:DNA mismatch repair protein Mlh1 isoform X1 n=1 Tax=Oopsacas minuta TaxID=111878 RepID=A0AAV7K9T7_9METZ|nr:DNA mismatch repair protein Mlh1 isoform X1 [Oopsacas minuta]